MVPPSAARGALHASTDRALQLLLLLVTSGEKGTRARQRPNVSTVILNVSTDAQFLTASSKNLG